MRRFPITNASAALLVALAFFVASASCSKKSSQPASSGACPDGATEKGAAPPKGTLLYCVKSGTKHGPWTEYYRTTGAIKLKGQYADGKMSGTWASYFDSAPNKGTGTVAAQKGDKPRQHDVGAYTAGMKSGTWVRFYESGKKNRETMYTAGAAQSSWTAWRENGAKWATGSIKGMRDHGPFSEWHPNGKLAAKGNHEKGKKAGEWKYWDPDGNPSTKPQGDFGGN